jgi:hypothetical protein
MNLETPSTRHSAGTVFSLVFVWGFALAGVLWPFLRLAGGRPEHDILLVPLVLGGAVFLISSIVAHVALSSGDDASLAQGKKAARILWGCSAMAMVMLIFWDVAQWVRPDL